MIQPVFGILRKEFKQKKKKKSEKQLNKAKQQESGKNSSGTNAQHNKFNYYHLFASAPSQ